MPLYLVSTPIGNLADMTLRAVDVLRAADVIACEDTRRTRRLLEHHDIAARRLLSYHEHNEARRVPELAAELTAGRSVALVTNAGTPLISDPGFRLVVAAHAAGVAVVPIPGPCAVLAALCASGLPVHRFTFVGFPPKGPGKLRAFLRAEQDNPGSLVLYESPNRLGKLLAAAMDVIGPDRQAAVCRELTKMHEEIRRGTLSELAAYYPASPPANRKPRGEIVVVIAPQGRGSAGSNS